MTLTVASNTGRATETRTSICAARWKITSGLRCVDQVDDRGRREIETVEREPTVGQRARGRQVRERARREIVDDVDAPVLGEETVDERRPDEAGAARHQCLHGRAPTRARRARARRRCGCPDATVAPAPTIVSAVSETSGLSTAYAPTTELCTLPPCETRAPVCSTAPSSSARASTTAAAPSTDACTRAPASMRAPSPISTGAVDVRVGLDRGVALHPHAGRDLACAGRGRVRQPAAPARRRAPRGTSRAFRCRASTRRSGSRTAARARASMRGNVSRSTDTLRRGGIRVEERRLEHVRAGVDPVARRLAGRGLLDERDHAAVGLGRHDAERARVVDLRERDRRLRAVLVVEAHHRVEIEAGEHVAVAHDDALVDARRPRSGSRRRSRAARPRPRSATTMSPNTSWPEPSWREVLVERVGQVAHRQHDLVDAVRREPRELAFEVRLVRDRQQRLRRRERQRPEPGSLAPDEDDRFHGFDVVVVAAVVGVVAACRGRRSVVGTGRHRRRRRTRRRSRRPSAFGEVRHRRRIADARDRLALRQERDHHDVALVELVLRRVARLHRVLLLGRSVPSHLPTAHCSVPGFVPHLSPFFTVVPRNVKPVGESFQPPYSK